MMNASGERVPNGLCTTNDNVKQLVAQKIRQTLPSTRTPRSWTSPRWTAMPPACARCARRDQAEGSGMGSILPLVNYVAEQVQSDYPDVLMIDAGLFRKHLAADTIRLAPTS